jgi:UDP-galactopyranose mutase
VIYDCMDELSGFLGAPPELLERERELLAWADAVFTGGPSLYRAKRDRHPHVYCFPSSVDVEHFAQAGVAPDPEDQAALPHPRIGYYGVVDERIDLKALDALAAQHPEWSVVVVGPVVKIDPATLPNRPNLHYLGARDYAQLPAYLSAWDLCIMPFAINAATRFISPTKVLEYMAAARPIASTPITDVAEPYGDIVHIGSGADGFVRACEQALAETGEDRDRRAARALEVLAGTSWDRTVAEMDRIVARLAGEPPAVHRAASPVGAVGTGSERGAAGRAPEAVGKESDR